MILYNCRERNNKRSNAHKVFFVTRYHRFIKTDGDITAWQSCGVELLIKAANQQDALKEAVRSGLYNGVRWLSKMESTSDGESSLAIAEISKAGYRPNETSKPIPFDIEGLKGRMFLIQD